MISSNTQLGELYANLPDSIREYVRSEHVSNNLNEIIETWGIPNSEKFIEYSFMLLIGGMEIDDFTTIIQSQFGLDAEVSNEILIDLHTRILNHAWQMGIDESEDKTVQQVVLSPLQPQAEIVHNLDIEIPPQNLPMVESQEEHDRLVKLWESETQAKTGQSDSSQVFRYAPEPQIQQPVKSYNERVQTAASKLSSMLQSRTGGGQVAQTQTQVQETAPTSTETPQFKNPILEKYYSEATPIAPVVEQQPPQTEPDSHFPPQSTPKFSYHDKDPYREAPDA